jgi:hypothetical protein
VPAGDLGMPGSRAALLMAEAKHALVQRESVLEAQLDTHTGNATHKTPQVKNWLLRHPRFHLNFTSTSSSWLNLVERWFAELTNRNFAVPLIAASPHWKRMCGSGPASGTPTRSPSYGPRPRMTSSRPSLPTAAESTTHDTSVLRRKSCD